MDLLFFCLSKTIHYLYNYSWQLLGIIALFFSFTYMDEQKNLIFFVLLIEFVKILFTRKICKRFHPIVSLWCFLYVFRELFFFVYTWGISNRIVLRPLFFSLLFIYAVARLSTEDSISKTLNIMKFSYELIVYYTIYVLLSRTFCSWLPNLTIPELYGSQQLFDGLLRYWAWNITSIIILCPFFLIISSMRSKFNNDISSNHYISAFSMLVSLVIVFFTGRRALWALVGINAIFVCFWYCYRILKKKMVKKKLVLILVVLPLFIIFNYDYCMKSNEFNSILARIGSIFDFTEDASNNLRKEQASHLINAFYVRPLLGYGYESRLKSYKRSSDGTNFELAYHKMLFNTGLLGVLSYFLLIIIIVLLCIYVIIKSNRYSLFALASLAMLIGISFANATNPYLGAFSTQWVIFYPLMAINRYLLDRK